MTFAAAFNVNYGQMDSARSRLQVELKAKANSGFCCFFCYGRNHNRRMIFRNRFMFCVRGFKICMYLHERVCVCVCVVSYPGVYPGVRSWSRKACEGQPAGSSWRVSADVNCQAFCLVH